MEQFPSTFNGLSRLEHETLQVISHGYTKLDEIFHHTSEMEERPYFGDTQFYSNLDLLTNGKVPAIKIMGPGLMPRWNLPRDLGRWRISLTKSGQSILTGAMDWIYLNGINHWVGGTHIQGRKESPWRWNPEQLKLELRDFD